MGTQNYTKWRLAQQLPGGASVLCSEKKAEENRSGGKMFREIRQYRFSILQQELEVRLKCQFSFIRSSKVANISLRGLNHHGCSGISLSLAILEVLM